MSVENHWHCGLYTVACVLAAIGTTAQASEHTTGPGDDPASSSVAQLRPIEELDLQAMLETPVVEAASRRQQSLNEAPAAVTVITSDEITSLGAPNVAEILRRVPGLHVMQTNANNYNLGLRGYNTTLNNRVLMLVDGRDVGELNFGYAPWAWLALHPGEIERIEVVRGPGTTLYGSNALSGVVSISTRRPLDSAIAEAEVMTGLQYIAESPAGGETLLDNTGNGYGAVAWANRSRTVGARLSLGYSHTPEFIKNDPEPGEAVRTFGEFGYYGALALQLRPNDDTDVLARVTHAQSDSEVTNDTLSDPLSLLTSEQAFSLSVEGRGLLADALTLRLLADGARLDIRTDNPSESFRAHGLIQGDLSLFDDRNVLTLGADAAYLVSEIFGVSPQRVSLAGVVQDELRLLRDRSLTLSAGVRLERIDYQDDGGVDVSYRNVSPRGAIVWRFAQDHDVRASIATANRTPTPFETSVDISIENPAGPPNRFVLGNPEIEPEQLTTVEVGYRGRVAEALRVDAAVFANRFTNVVNVRPEGAIPLFWDNLQDLDQLGVEAALDFATSARVSGYLHYAYVMSRDRATDDDVHAAPDHIVGIGIDVLPIATLRLHADANISTGLRPFIPVGTTNFFSPRFVSDPLDAIVNVRIGYAAWGGDGEVFLIGHNLIGFSNNLELVRQYPSPTAAPIGASILLGVRISTARP